MDESRLPEKDSRVAVQVDPDSGTGLWEGDIG